MSVRAVARKLGGRAVFRRDVATDADLIAVVRAGLPVKALDSVLAQFKAMVGAQVDIYNAVGRPRTLQRKRSGRAKLSADESDRLARLARVLVRAEEAFGGDAETAQRWLTEPNRALNAERPISLLDSDAGALVVERVLGRIEHGVYS